MNNLTKEQVEEYQKFYESLYSHPSIKAIAKISQHRGSNTYLHVLKVTKLAYQMARGSIMEINFHDLILGAMLHDYFLYDWRVERDKLKGHGHNHPYIALENAKKEFDINWRVENIITSHMWPINIFNFYKSYEAFLVSLADKLVSTKEALTSKKYKLKHRKEELSKIFNLEAY